MMHNYLLPTPSPLPRGEGVGKDNADQHSSAVQHQCLEYYDYVREKIFDA
jgi:hypothetical protein